MKMFEARCTWTKAMKPWWMKKWLKRVMHHA